MEYKFKALYDGSLIPCIPVESNNLILRIVFSPEFLKIGRLREETGWREDLPVLPIFQYTGKKDKHDKDIYCGHIVKYNNDICTVMWDRIFALYRVIKKENGHICGTLMNSETHMEIIGHEAIK
jgi:hypothetical protein